MASLDGLRADVRAAAVELVARARAAGEPVIVASTLRTPAEQDRLCRAGYSRVCGDAGAHTMGLAFDVALLGAGGPEWPTTPEGRARWERVGAIGESLGLVWGGRWPTPDWPHFQARDAQARVNARLASRRAAVPLALALGAAIVAYLALAPRRRARRRRAR